MSQRLTDLIDNYFTKDLQQQLLAFRQDLHEYPELSLQEFETQKKSKHLLDAFSPYSVEEVAETGLLAKFKGQVEGIPPVVIRGDLDALPIHENDHNPIVSKTPGVMHACGHDVHTSWAIGAGYLLSQTPASGEVWVLLQPAEEVSQGAKAVLESGVLEGVGAIIGGHVDRNYPVGQVVVHEGAIAASSDTFHITINGEGSHGARPHEGKDPLPCLASLIHTLQTIVSRRIAPSDVGVVTIGKILAGTTHNVIPEKAELWGTIRSVDAQVRTKIHEELHKIVKGKSVSYDMDVSLDLKIGQPPIINLPHYVRLAEKAVEQTLGPEGAASLIQTNMGAEDFAYYLEQLPGAFLRIGARAEQDVPIPAHNSLFFVEDNTIFVGAIVLAEFARQVSLALSS